MINWGKCSVHGCGGHEFWRICYWSEKSIGDPKRRFYDPAAIVAHQETRLDLILTRYFGLRDLKLTHLKMNNYQKHCSCCRDSDEQDSKELPAVAVLEVLESIRRTAIDAAAELNG